MRLSTALLTSAGTDCENVATATENTWIQHYHCFEQNNDRSPIPRPGQGPESLIRTWTDKILQVKLPSSDLNYRSLLESHILILTVARHRKLGAGRRTN